MLCQLRRDPGQPIVLTLYGPAGEVAVPMVPKRALELAQELIEPAVASLVSTVNQSLLWTGISAVALGVLLVSILSRRLLAPVTSLSVVAQELGKGDFSRRAPTEGAGELRQLSMAFNSMAANLEDAERQRRNLVADVAHELRTPVSNIQGYLEALKDGLLQPDEGTLQTDRLCL